jgi:hypothetical protein
MKKVRLLFLLCSVLFLGVSCSEEESSVQGVYSFGIDEIHSNFADFGIIETYLTGKGCIIVNQIFEADSEAELDKQAIAVFDANVKKIDSDELGSKLTGTTSFTYAISKATTEEGSSAVLKKKEYEFSAPTN